MMMRRCRQVILVFLCLLVAGCWDMDLLRDARLVVLVGFDVAENERLITTVVTRETPRGGEEQGQLVNAIHSAVSNTPRQGRMLVDLGVPGHFRAYKNQVILFGEERAKRDLYPVLDVFYRDPKNNISARMAVVEGTASEVMKLNIVESLLVAEYIDNLIESMEEVSKVPVANVQLVCPVLLDPGQDFALPLLQKIGEEVKVSGTALFHGHHLSGKLNPSESTMMLLLADEAGQQARFTYKVDPGAVENPANYLNLDVNKEQYERDVRVSLKEGRVDVYIRMKLRVSVNEYARDDFENEKNVRRLERQLGEGLEKQAQETLQKLQQARCDYLGIGRHLIAFYPEVWKKKKWSRDYGKVHFHPQIEVEILDSGILE